MYCPQCGHNTHSQPEILFQVEFPLEAVLQVVATVERSALSVQGNQQPFTASQRREAGGDVAFAGRGTRSLLVSSAF